ncbi:LacI family DNA-binding transcriptional regulator [Clostridiisalibacter paucivorans]|uniref:LacI family DNA-binding transcriptional regulator n=1 Tax=Clostridiisalibacter paucivorans TaxID=408753 RepID=UPI00047DBA95|nr:LacI family DNA-binding transcriptional regulator [Clostridiisalibacter paucivorans]
MSVTIKDVAKLAGVSISTVSRVINSSKPVSPEVKKKVLEVIEEIGYKPNEIARTLVTKKSFLIGVIVTNLSNSFVTEMVRGIEEIGKMYNYDILLCSTYGDKEAEYKYMQLLNRKQVEGIILISEVLNEGVKRQIKQYDIPFVFLSRDSYESEYSTVSIDNYDASYEMTNYLISLGHRNIAYVTNEKETKSMEKFRLEGYKKAISENENMKELVFYSEGKKVEQGYEVARDVLSCDEKITSVFCSRDELAIGVINYFYDNGVNVPENISVAGFGDIPMASIFRPKLTTIREPFYDIGAVAIRKIIKELKGEKTNEEHIILPFQIQKRKSCIKNKS